MKKILITLILIVSVFILASCKTKTDSSLTSGSEASTAVTTVGNTVIPGRIVYSKGHKEWFYPGLYEKDGSDHIRTVANERTGMSIDVTLYGAKPNDPNFDNVIPVKEAILDAQAGDEIYFPAGTYYFKTATLYTPYISHINLKTGVNLRGESKETVSLVSNFTQLDNQKETTVISVVNASNVKISGVTITSIVLDSELPDKDISSKNSYNYDAPKYGISVENTKIGQIVSNVSIDNVLIEKFQRIGIRVKSSRDVAITNSKFQKAVDLGGGGAGYGISIQGSGNNIDLTNTNFDTLFNVVENNEFIGPWLRHGTIIQYYAHNNLITNNIYRDGLLDCIDLHGEDEYLNEVSYNEVFNTRAGAGIAAGNSGATHDATGPGNYIHHNTIDGGRRGIDVILGTTYSFIYDNTIKNLSAENSTGIQVSNAPHTVIKNNVIENIRGEKSKGINIVYAFIWNNPAAGIPSVEITDNKFTNNKYAMFIETFTDDSLIKDNTFTENGTDFVNSKANFVLPGRSEDMDPKNGQVLVASQDTYIESGTPISSYGASTTLKFKGETIEPGYNRVVFYEFDNYEYEAANYDKIYFRVTVKARDGQTTMNVWGKENLEWNENSLSWNTASYIDSTQMFSKIYDPNNELVKVIDYKFLATGDSFYTYYIDITNYVKNLSGGNFSFIITNEGIEEMYNEFRPKEHKVLNEQPALIFVNE
ncbi:MAG: hypothetical protein K0Q49_169 [Haloplasmataceae bacterium]|nr:hypothetical protein [Haloplasmataceae bacterium]